MKADFWFTLQNAIIRFKVLLKKGGRQGRQCNVTVRWKLVIPFEEEGEGNEEEGKEGKEDEKERWSEWKEEVEGRGRDGEEG